MQNQNYQQGQCGFQQNNNQYQPPQNYNQPPQNFNQPPQNFNQPPQYQNNNQQQMFNQPPQQQGNNQMAAPFMPQPYNTTQFSSRQDYRNHLQMDGWEKLRNCKRVTMRKLKSEGFAETCWAVGFPTLIDIRFEEQAIEEAFEVRFKTPGCCSSSLNGELSSFNYYGENINKQKLYEVDYKRQAICLKEALCPFPLLGWYGCLQCFINPCFSSKATLSKNGNKVSQYKIGFSCCRVKSVDIKDGQDGQKFVLKRQSDPGNYNLLTPVTIKDRMDREINNYKVLLVHQMYIDGDGNRQKILDYVQVDFPQNGDIDDKASLMFAASKYVL